MATSPVSAGSAVPPAKPLPPKTATDEAGPSPREVAKLPNAHRCGASGSGSLDYHHA